MKATYKPTEKRMRELIRRANDPAQMIPKRGEDHIVHAYQRDVGELIMYVRELEARLNIESTYL